MKKEKRIWDRKTKEGGWDYFQPAQIYTVISAEKKLKWYDRERFEEIYYTLKEEGCRCYFDMTDDELEGKYIRKGSSVQVYKKYPDTLSFEEQVQELKKLLDRYKYLFL